MGMPILALLGRKLLEQAFGNDVFDTVEVGVRCVAVEQGALCEILVHLMAEMMRFHLVARVILHRMESDKVDIHPSQRRIALKRCRSSRKHVGFRAGGNSRRAGRWLDSTGTGTGGERHEER